MLAHALSHTSIIPTDDGQLYRLIVCSKASSNLPVTTLFCANPSRLAVLPFEGSKGKLVLNSLVVKGSNKGINIEELGAIDRADELPKGRHTAKF